MRLATIDDGSRDGRLAVLRGGTDEAVLVAGIATLQEALEDWPVAEPLLSRAAKGDGKAVDLARSRLLAPLPRAWQWLDASAYPSHAELMDRALGISGQRSGQPLMYQGMSHHFYAPDEDVPFPSAEHGIDFEGEIGIIVDHVPMGTPPQDALGHIRLLVQINDWSLRALAGPEMKTGFGWIQAKPACSMAPFAVTPDTFGRRWRDGQLDLRLSVHLNGEQFGNPRTAAMAFGFHELVAHAARTRALCAGTVIGSGTVSNPDFRVTGSTCIAERRGIEIVDSGNAATPFLSSGDRVRMAAVDEEGWEPFGAIDQKVVVVGASEK